MGNKRKRKNSDQIQILFNIFKKHPRWDRDTVDRATRLSGLSRAQVYKWGWDQKKNKNSHDFDFDKPTKDEFGGYSKHDFVENRNGGIAQLLNIDLNQEVMKLINGLDDELSQSANSSRVKCEQTLNLVDTKKRSLKEKSKVDSSSSQHEYSVTPVSKPPMLSKSLSLKSAATKWKKRLFDKTEQKKPVTDENKPTPSSSNSQNINIQSKINTSDLKCSEILTPKKLDFDNFEVIKHDNEGKIKEPFRVLNFENMKKSFYTPEPIIHPDDWLLGREDFIPSLYSCKNIFLSSIEEESECKSEKNSYIPFDVYSQGPDAMEAQPLEIRNVDIEKLQDFSAFDDFENRSDSIHKELCSESNSFKL